MENNKQFEQKCKELIFKDISQNYFNKNFGSLSKTDFELIIFKNYVLACEDSEISTSDYDLSKKLGIKQSKIRSLKQLKYKKYDSKDESWWKNELNINLKNAHYDEINRSIKFIVEDINVKEELIHYIETNGWYNDTSLNKKLISLPLECYVNILVDDEFKTKFSREAIEKFQIKCKKSNLDDDWKDKLIGFSKNITKDTMVELLKTGTKEAILLLLQFLPLGGVTTNVINTLINIIRES